MKVAYTIGALARGGAENLLLDVFRNIKESSIDAVLIHRHFGPMQDEFDKSGVKRIQLTHRKGHLLQYLWAYRKIIRAEKVDIIHAQHLLDSIYGRLAVGKKYPIVLTFHGSEGCMCSRCTAMLYRIAMLCANKICFVSETQRKMYIARYGSLVEKKSVVVYNGIDFGKFENACVKDNDQKPKERIGDAKLCMVGNFNSVRNHMVVCQALAKLKDMPICFYFIGGKIENEADKYDACVAFCKENGLNVEFMGQRKDVPELLREMDGFVYASRTDTFGIAVIEAMAAGLPVVVNDWSVMQEVCDGAPAVWMYKSRDVNDCADRMKDLINDIQTYNQKLQIRCERQAQWVRERFSIQNHIKQLEKVYVWNIR